jgi:acetyl esterase/lipase
MQKMIFSLLLIVFFFPGTSFFPSEINFPSTKVSVPKKIERVSSEYDYRVLYNIEYAHMDSQSLQLDLYQPQGVTSATPVLVWLHGGAFTSGDKSNAGKYAPMFAKEGIAVASVNYRLAPGAIFPAQVQDVKGAIRFLRANAAKYHLDANHIGILGTSAGGAFASLIGVSCGEKDLEGNVGGNLSYSSCVQATINCFGSFSFDNMMKLGFDQSREAHLEKLFGCNLNTPEGMAKIRQMAPEFHLDKNDSPFLILHGEQDTSVPLQNSIDFNKKLQAAGIPSQLISDPNYDHDVRIIVAHFDEVMKFLNQYLR